MDDCMCDLDYNCGQHEADEAYWAQYFNATRPSATDVPLAYDPTDYKGRFWTGWDVA